MTKSGSSEESPLERQQRNRLPDWAVGVLAAESIALGIAIALPITPSKTGSTWSPAHLLTTDPSYLEKVFASFVLTNLLLLVLGLIALVVSRWSKTE